jgi:hypothetical protein
VSPLLLLTLSLRARLNCSCVARCTMSTASLSDGLQEGIVLLQCPSHMTSSSQRNPLVDLVHINVLSPTTSLLYYCCYHVSQRHSKRHKLSRSWHYYEPDSSQGTHTSSSHSSLSYISILALSSVHSSYCSSFAAVDVTAQRCAVPVLQYSSA